MLLEFGHFLACRLGPKLWWPSITACVFVCWGGGGGLQTNPGHKFKAMLG
jgi:hypothetical protein